MQREKCYDVQLRVLGNGLVLCAEKQYRVISLNALLARNELNTKFSRIKRSLIGKTGYQCPICSGLVQGHIGPKDKMKIKLGEDKIECLGNFVA